MARASLDEWFWSVESGPMAGVETYWKVPFERVGGTRPLMVDRDSTVSWTPAEKDERFLEVVEAVIAQSPDAGDIARVREMGASVAARHLIDSVPDWAMSRLPGWWELLTMSGKVAGFVMPVTYDECAREGLDEATIFHLGVVDGFRGIGLGRLLLRRATQTLVDHGVWRIYCDTASNNYPMIHLFESEGWTRLPVHERPL